MRAARTYAFQNSPKTIGATYAATTSQQTRWRHEMTKDEMLAAYEVTGFAYGYCVVRRKSDGVRGTLDFNHGSPTEPRIYTNFQEA